MIKGLTKDKHWFTDYSYVPLTLAAPTLMKFKNEKWASNLCYVLSSTALGYSLLTDAKWGAVKLIPYKTHAMLDFSLGIVTLGALMVPKKTLSKRSRNTILVMGLTGIAVGILSLVGAKNS